MQDDSASDAVAVRPLVVPGRAVRPLGLASLTALAGAIAVLAWPDQTDDVFVRSVGAGLVVLAASGSVLSPTSRRRAWNVAMAAIALVGGALLVGGFGAVVTAGRVVGATVILLGAVGMVGPPRLRMNRGAWSFIAIAAGVAMVGAARPMLSLLIGLLAVAVAVMAIVVVGSLVDGRREVAPTLSEVRELVSQWLQRRPAGARDRNEVRSQLLFEGREAQSRLARFVVLMCLASAIATLGVIGDSTAVVIGAMLVAPLMTPLMAISLSIVMGWPRRLGRHGLIALSGIAIAVGVGVLLALVAPATFDTATNSQVLSRSNPTVLDLITACAAGAAGAYAISRRDVADSLPGAAIAISLVPPLTVTGVAIAAGDSSAATGSFLLFATNAVAILLVGGLTFLLTGVAPIQRIASAQHRVAAATAAVAALGIVVLSALFVNGGAAAKNVLERSTIEDAVQDWLDPHPDHGLVRVDIGSDDITVVIAGPTDDAPQANELAPQVAASLDRHVRIEVRLVVEEVDVAEASG